MQGNAQALADLSDDISGRCLLGECSGIATPRSSNYAFGADSLPRLTRPQPDPARGAEVAKSLRDLGVKGILVQAAELGYITELKCGMPQYFCPEELGGAGHFESLTDGYSDWNPTHEHFPLSKTRRGQENSRQLGPCPPPLQQARLFAGHRAVTRERSRENQTSSRDGRREHGRPASGTRRRDFHVKPLRVRGLA